MDNKTSVELVSFLDELQKFLESSNPNLGRKSTKREEFIATIMDKVRNFVGDPEAETPKGTRSKLKEGRIEAMKGTVMRMEPNEQIRKALNEQGAAVMTEEASMQADKELGNPHNMTEEK